MRCIIRTAQKHCGDVMAASDNQQSPAIKRVGERRAAEHAIWRILASADDIATAASQILEAVCNLCAWDLGELWMLDERDGILRMTDYWQSTPTDLTEFIDISKATTFVRGAGLPGRVWATGSPSWIEDVVADPNFPRARFAKEVGIHAAFGFPIKTRSDVIGVMSFYSPEFRKPDLDLLESLDVIGGQIGHFIARVRAQQALTAGEARWQRIFDGAPIGIFHSLPSGRLMDVNPAFASILGYRSPAETLQVVNRTSIPESLYVDPERRNEILKTIQEQPGQWARCEVLGRRPDGDVIAGELQVRLLDDYNGETNVNEGFLIDITERKQMERDLQSALDEVRELTLRDHLTGLHNRRHLEERVDIELAAAQRNKSDVSVIMLDIDHFKAVNDTHGHSAGDAVLQNLAITLGKEVRPDDVLARYGGEEFVLLMRQTDTRQAMEAAERLRISVGRIPNSFEGRLMAITISCGVASLSECADRSQDSLLRLADERLYRAKELGRNRVIGPDNFRPLDGSMGGDGEGI